MVEGRSRGRPNRAVVTRDGIAQAALEVIADVGYEKLTMVRIAKQLGVAPSALYNHVPGKEHLLYLVEDAVMASVDTTALQACLDGKLAPYDALLAWAYSYRDALARHSPLISEIAVMPIFGAQETVAMYELVARLLIDANVPLPRVMDSIVALESFIFGSAFDVEAPETIFDIPPDCDDDRDAAPTLRAAIGQRAVRGDHPNPYADEPFRLGLEILVEGLLNS